MAAEDIVKEKVLAGKCLLFLGAGASIPCGAPSGQGLAESLANRFNVSIPTSDLVRFCDLLAAQPGIDRIDIDKHIIDLLETLQPGKGHRLLPTFKWPAIFTTNYDRLIEKAYDLSNSPAQRYRVIISTNKGLDLFEHGAVPLFKMHGCVSAVSKTTPLVLTTADYRRTRKQRSKFLQFLANFNLEYTWLFTGYSFADGIVTELIEDLKESRGLDGIRNTYAILPYASKEEVAFFETHRIQTIRRTFDEFLSDIDKAREQQADAILRANRAPRTLHVGRRDLTLSAQFRVKFEEQYEIVPAKAHRLKAPVSFYRGDLPNWNELESSFDVERDISREIMSDIRTRLSASRNSPDTLLLFSLAGGGKSTVLLRVAYDLSKNDSVPVIKARGQGPWQARLLQEFSDELEQAFVLILDDLEVYYNSYRTLLRELRDLRVPCVVLSAGRMPDCNNLLQDKPLTHSKAYRIAEKLTDREVNHLVDRLAVAELLPSHKIPNERAYWEEKIRHDYDGQLLVSMLSIVGDSTFSDIIISEYDGLRSKAAQTSYDYVCFLYKYKLLTKRELLQRLSGVDWSVFTNEVIRRDSERVIIEDYNERIGQGYFRARHQIIAAEITRALCSTPEKYFSHVARIIDKLIEYDKAERSLLINLLRNKDLRQDLADPSRIRKVFDLAIKELPGDATILLHAGKFEMEVGDLRRATILFETGLQASPLDDYIIHRLGMVNLEIARREETPIARALYYNKATDYFQQKQRIDPFSPYSYVNHIELLLSRAEESSEQEDQEEYLRNAYELVLLGLSMVSEDETSRLVACRTRILDSLGRSSLATEKLEQEVSNGGRAIAFELLGMRLIETKQFRRAEDVLNAGCALHAGNRRLLSLLIRLRVDTATTSEHFKAAHELIRAYRQQNTNDSIVDFDHAFILFALKRRDEARRMFEELRTRTNMSVGTFRVRRYLLDGDGAVAVFSGKLFNTEHGWRVLDTDTGQRFRIGGGKMAARGLVEGASVMYSLGFCFAGPTAELHRTTTASGRA